MSVFDVWLPLSARIILPFLIIVRMRNLARLLIVLVCKMGLLVDAAVLVAAFGIACAARNALCACND